MEYPAIAEENKCEFAQIQLTNSYQNTIPTIKLSVGKVVIEISNGMSQETISYVLKGIRNIC